MHETERGEPCERHSVRGDAHDGVDDLDRGLRHRRGAPPRLEEEADPEQHDARCDQCSSRDRKPIDVPGEAGESKCAAEEDREACEARGSHESGGRSTFAPAVHRSDRVAAREQHGSEGDGRDQQSQRLLEGVEPECGHDSGRAEELAVEQAEKGAGSAARHDERPGGSQRGQTTARTAQEESQEHEDESLADVAEHHSEHEDEGDCGERRWIDVLVARSAVGLDEGPKRAREPH